jgi:hypothetical protein
LSLDTAYAGSAEDTEAAIDDSALIAMLAAWAGGDDEYEKRMALELKLILFFGPNNNPGHRRANPKARAMRRHGRKYQVRQDHGSAATYKGRGKRNGQLKAQGYRAKRDVLGLDWDMNVSGRLCPDCYGPQYGVEVGDYDTLCTPGYCGTRHGFWM